MDNKLVEAFMTWAIKEVPGLVWLFVILILLWGLFLVIKQIYNFFHGVKRDHITDLKEHLSFKDQVVIPDLKEHLNFKDQVISDISSQKAQLEEQNCELRAESCRKDEIISSAITYLTEKEKELETVRREADSKIREFKNALGTSFWIIERETFMRKLFLSLLIKSTVPSDIDEFLSKNFKSILPMIRSDDEIFKLTLNPPDNSDLFEFNAPILSNHYLQLPITEEISLFETIRDGIMALPSYSEEDVPNEDKK